MPNLFSDFTRKAILIFLCCFFISINASGSDILVPVDRDEILPIGTLDEQQISIITLGKPSKNYFSDYCRFYTKVDNFNIADASSETNVLKKIPQSSMRLIAVYSYQPWVVDAFSKVVADTNTVAIFFIADKYIQRFPLNSSMTVVLARSDSYISQVQAAETIFGGRNISSKSNINISTIGNIDASVAIEKCRLGFSTPQKEGFSSRLKSKIDSIVRFNIQQRSFPGCQIVIARHGNVIINEAYGRLTYDAEAKRVDKETLYDIASMTKATATISGLMYAYDEGLYELDEPISKYLPQLSETDKSDITVRELLYHESGMPSTLNTYALMVDSTTFTGKLMTYKNKAPYTVKLDRGVFGHSSARRRTDVMHNKASNGYETEIAHGIFGGAAMQKVISDAIYNSKLKEKKYRYSCLNFCMLKDMEETLTGEPHEQYVRDCIFAPIGAWHAMYNPASKGYRDNVAPTEKDNFMRRQLLKGYVHDEIAAYSGGVQGNAGLFSNAEDIAKLCQTWLNGGYYGDIDIFSQQTVELFTTDVSKTANRGLGFDRASRVKGLQGIDFPETTYGHTGFTGTCFWIDPHNEIIIVFLCNRVYPSRDNASFRKYSPRTEIMKAVYESIVE